MYYGSQMDGFIEDAQNVFKAFQGFPQTQKDIRQLAKTSQQIQSPQVQKAIQDVQGEIEQFAKVQLALQAFSTVAVFGLFLIALKNHSSGK